MTLKDVKLINRTNKKALFIGVVLVFIGSSLSVLLSYGWLLSAFFGVIGVLVSLKFQQSQLLKVFGEKLNAKVVGKPKVIAKVIKKTDVNAAKKESDAR